MTLFLAVRLVVRGVRFGQCYGFISSQSLGHLKGVGGGIYELALALFLAIRLVAKRVGFGQYYGFIYSQSMGPLKGVGGGIWTMLWLQF